MDKTIPGCAPIPVVAEISTPFSCYLDDLAEMLSIASKALSTPLNVHYGKNFAGSSSTIASPKRVSSAGCSSELQDDTPYLLYMKIPWKYIRRER
jgi:hypothetical protein